MLLVMLPLILLTSSQNSLSSLEINLFSMISFCNMFSLFLQKFTDLLNWARNVSIALKVSPDRNRPLFCQKRILCLAIECKSLECKFNSVCRLFMFVLHWTTRMWMFSNILRWCQAGQNLYGFCQNYPANFSVVTELTTGDHLKSCSNPLRCILFQISFLVSCPFLQTRDHRLPTRMFFEESYLQPPRGFWGKLSANTRKSFEQKFLQLPGNFWE